MIFLTPNGPRVASPRKTYFWTFRGRISTSISISVASYEWTISMHIYHVGVVLCALWILNWLEGPSPSYFTYATAEILLLSIVRLALIGFTRLGLTGKGCRRCPARVPHVYWSPVGQLFTVVAPYRADSSQFLNSFIMRFIGWRPGLCRKDSVGAHGIASPTLSLYFWNVSEMHLEWSAIIFSTGQGTINICPALSAQRYVHRALFFALSDYFLELKYFPHFQAFPCILPGLLCHTAGLSRLRSPQSVSLPGVAILGPQCLEGGHFEGGVRIMPPL